MTSVDVSGWVRQRAPGLPRPSRVGVLTILLLGWATACFTVMAARGGMAWHFFASGGAVLSDLDDGGRAGLHVYAEYPLLQIGPVALALARVLGQLAGGHGLLAAQLLGVLLGAVVVGLTLRVRTEVRRRSGLSPGQTLDGPTAVAIGCFTPLWMYAAVSSAHLDDVLALTFGVVALACVVLERPVWAGIAIAAGVDSKPWALPFIVLLLALPSARGRAVGFGVAVLGIAAGWLPFFVADPQTVRALHYTIVNRPLSGLHLLDPDAARTPAWDRPLQTVLGLALGAVAVLRHRLTGVLLLVMAARLALDPGTNRYYTAGLAVGAIVWDMCGSRWRWPWWSLAAAIGLHWARWVPALDALHGPALIVFAVVAVAAVLVDEHGWGRSGLNRRPTDYESAALTD